MTSLSEEQVADRLDRLVTVLERMQDRLMALDALLERSRSAVPPSTTATLRPRGDYWELRYQGRELLVRDSRGVRHLARLLAEPNRPVHALELVRGAAGRPGVLDDVPFGREGDVGPVLDPAARRAYRERLRVLEQDLQDEPAGTARSASMRAEHDALRAELARATALLGRDRRMGDPAERARSAVTKAIKSVIASTAERERVIGAHLARCVRTGTFCSYCVEPST